MYFNECLKMLVLSSNTTINVFVVIVRVVLNRYMCYANTFDKLAVMHSIYF